MINKGFFRKIHLVLWFVITMLTGILAGFLTSHSIILGRYFTWLIESGNNNVFVDTFSVFRQATHANVHYNLFLWASLFTGVIWTIFCFIVRKSRIIGIIAGLSSLWVGFVFFASGFARAEEAVSTGIADEALRNFFVSWNLPMHTSFAFFYTLCFFLLMISGIRSGKTESHA